MKINIAFGLAVIAVLAVFPCGAQGTLPPDLLHLQELVGDADILVAAARRFDLQQQELLKWDSDLAADHADAGQRDLATIKAEGSKRRLNLIEQSWLFTLQHYPNNARANNYYGEFLYDYRGRIPDAIQKWLLAIRMDGDLAGPQNNLGIHYFHNGDYDKGLKHLGMAVELEPHNPDFLYNLSQMYMIHFPYLQKKYGTSEKKLYSEAMRLSREAAKYAPRDYEIVKDYALNFFAAEKFDVEVDWKDGAGAWRQARTVGRNDNERFYCHLQEGRAWIRAEDWARALAALIEARTFEPDSIVVQKLISETEAKLRQ